MYNTLLLPDPGGLLTATAVIIDVFIVSLYRLKVSQSVNLILDTASAILKKLHGKGTYTKQFCHKSRRQKVGMEKVG